MKVVYCFFVFGLFTFLPVETNDAADTSSEENKLLIIEKKKYIKSQCPKDGQFKFQLGQKVEPESPLKKRKTKHDPSTACINAHSNAKQP